MARKKHIKIAIPFLVAIGVMVMVAFYILFGGMMLIRYLLGAIMFATLTVSLIKLLNNKLGKKKIRIR